MENLHPQDLHNVTTTDALEPAVDHIAVHDPVAGSRCSELSWLEATRTPCLTNPESKRYKKSSNQQRVQSAVDLMGRRVDSGCD